MQRGLSLIEMLIALGIAAIVIAGVYRSFAVQQKNFVIQEQVAEAQQNVRSVMDLIARDIRVAGFGRPSWAVGGFAESVNLPGNPSNQVTVVGVFGPPIAALQNDSTMGMDQLILDQNVDLTAGDNLLVFEPDTIAAPLRYRTVVVWNDAAATNTIDIDSEGDTPGTRETLDMTLRATAQVYKVETITYALNGTTLTRDGNVLATSVTNFQITDQYNPAVPDTFGRYQIVMAVTTRTSDPDFPGGFRTRTLTSTIKARNLSL